MATLRWQPILFLLAATALAAHSIPASGQGMLVDTRPDHHFRLPRPIIPPNPKPTQPSSRYRI